MNRIIINEIDNTTNIFGTDNHDVVYIPGFSIASLDEGEQSAKPHVPTLCNSLADFWKYFGYDAPVFKTEQYYPASFSATATPSGPVSTSGDKIIMFQQGDFDPSYVEAVMLLSQGLRVVYERVNEVSETASASYDVTVENMYQYLAGDCYSVNGSLIDKGLDIKYLTSGAYPTFEYNMPLSSNSPGSIARLMAQLAQARGDCIAFIDHTDNPSRPLTGKDSVFSVVNNAGAFPAGSDEDLFAVMFTPWANYATDRYSTYGTRRFPASYAYFLSLAKSIRTNPSWLAIAGVSRGQVPLLSSLNTDDKLTNAIADNYQPENGNNDYGSSINAITYINGYGYCLWGNRTLRLSNENRVGSAMGYLNLRNMVCDIKKLAFISAQRLLFEQNTDILWVNFKSYMTPLLDQLVSGGGISSYKLIKNQSDNKAKLSATIRIYPIYAVDQFEISVALSDEEVTTGE